uniref:Amino acid transporter transmembrane domain-containing protein n=1 Tax=Aegilops tauschii TaxID=37682 RepID=M8AX63_AEGTA
MSHAVPLLGRKEAARPEQAAQKGARNDGSASFVRTCLNGVNALSGVPPHPSSMVFLPLVSHVHFVGLTLFDAPMSVGVGVLSVPYALSEGGWLSLLLLAAVAAACWYTGLLVGRCMDADPAIRTYPDIGQRAFGSPGRLLVSSFLYAEVYLVAVGFLILDGDNLDKLFPGSSVALGPVSLAGKQLFVVLVALMVAPTTWLRSLGVLAYVSAAGVFASLVVVLSVLWVAAVDGVGFSGRGTTTPLRLPGPPPRPRPGPPPPLGLYTFCYCGHAVFPTLYTCMKQKSQFPKMLAICFVLCTLNYGSMAVLGYLMYGDGVQSQVTLNLPAARLSSKIAIYTTLVNPLAKYALMVTPIATVVEERICVAVGQGSAVPVAVRTLLVLSTVAVAIAVPFFGYLMALVGSFLSVGVCMLLPCVCYLRIFGAPSVKCSRTAMEAAAIFGILALGALVAVTGTYSSVMQIIHHL